MAVFKEKLTQEGSGFDALSALGFYKNRARGIKSECVIGDQAHRVHGQDVTADFAFSDPTVYMRRNPARGEPSSRQDDREALARVKTSEIIAARTNVLGVGMFMEQREVEVGKIRRDPSAPDVIRTMSIGSENFIGKMADKAGLSVSGDKDEQYARENGDVIFRVSRGADNFIAGGQLSEENSVLNTHKDVAEVFNGRSNRIFSGISSTMKENLYKLGEKLKIWRDKFFSKHNNIIEYKSKEALMIPSFGRDNKPGLPILTEEEKKARRRLSGVVDTTNLPAGVNPGNYASLVRNSRSNNYY